MKNKVIFNVLGMSLVLLLLAGCAKPPQAEMDAAKAAVEQARAVQADLYVPAEFNAVQDSLNAALNMVTEQDSKFALFRNYKAATAKLVNIASMAGTLQQNAIAKKEEVKAECGVIMGELQAMMTTNREMLAKAPKGKEGKEAIEQIKGDLDAIDAEIPGMQSLFDAGDYLKARDKGVALKERAMAINTELTEVLTKANIKF